MRRTAARSPDQLIEDLFDAETRPMTAEPGTMAGSSPFVAFAAAHRDKIRKNLRTARNAEALSACRFRGGARNAHLVTPD